MAAELDVGASTVVRHWQANGLKPHVMRRFKASRNPKFIEKLEDIVGLYMSPALEGRVIGQYQTRHTYAANALAGQVNPT